MTTSIEMEPLLLDVVVSVAPSTHPLAKMVPDVVAPAVAATEMSGSEPDAGTGPGCVHSTVSYGVVVHVQPAPLPTGAVNPCPLSVTVTRPTASVASSLTTRAVTVTGAPNATLVGPSRPIDRSDSPANRVLTYTESLSARWSPSTHTLADDDTAAENGRSSIPEISMVGSELPAASGPGCSHVAVENPTVQLQPMPMASTSLKDECSEIVARTGPASGSTPVLLTVAV